MSNTAPHPSTRDWSVAERASLTAGAGMWTTAAIPAHDLPAIGLSDGPSGVRGLRLSAVGPSSVSVPCGTALAATWNPELIERVGALLGAQALERGAQVLLAPTVNLVRHPLAGRNFETYGEDPLLTGRIAAAYIRGVQSTGVIATIKHFLANETEFERILSNSIVDERTLRELYLVPFEVALRTAAVGAVMTSYNRLNGTWLANDRRWITDVLRGEFGFQGIVMSDWFAVLDTVEAARAGADLEMPGPGRAYGAALAGAVSDGRLAEQALTEIADRLATTIRRQARLGTAGDATLDPADRADDRRLAFEASCESMVLLHNDGVLPLSLDGLRSIAVIGDAAARPALMGGGSAQLSPFAAISPLAALRSWVGEHHPDVSVDYARGCSVERRGRAVQARFDVRWFAGALGDEAQPLGSDPAADGRVMWMEPPRATSISAPWWYRARAVLDVTEPGVHRFALSHAAPARLFVGGELLIDAIANPLAPGGGSEMSGAFSAWGEAMVELTAGQSAEIVLEGVGSTFELLPGLVANGAIVVHRPPLGEPDEAIREAADLAARSELAIVVVGTSEEWESEFADRASMALPGTQHQLLAAVCAANPRTVAVVNAGGPVLLDGTEGAAATLVCWFGGQELGPALTAVLCGERDAGGRLPFTIPERVEHCPAHDNFPGVNGEVRYGEGVFMGYRGYQHRARAVRAPFGAGQSLTTFQWSPLRASTDKFHADTALSVTLDVTNTGSRPGTEIVQIYVEPAPHPLPRPPRELRGFAKVDLQPGERRTVTVELDGRAFAAYDPGQPDAEDVFRRVELAVLLAGAGRGPRPRRQPGWWIEPGEYTVVAARHADDTQSAVVVHVPEAIQL